MRSLIVASTFLAAIAPLAPLMTGCSSTTPASASEEGAALGNGATGTLPVDILYVHGLETCASGRPGAGHSLADLEAAVNAALPDRIAAFEAAHPGVKVVTRSARANIYTAKASPWHPSDSNDPTALDDWEVGDPGCSAKRQGEPCTTAFEWRYRLTTEIQRLFPGGAHNLVLVGHSTGARAAFEIASNTGPDGVGTYDWGVADHVLGVMSVHGMIDALNPNRYDIAGPTSFDTACKYGDVASVFGVCLPGNGWCEYAGDVSGVPSAEAVAATKSSLVLTSPGPCSPAMWKDVSDGTLPFGAQGHPHAPGMTMEPAPDGTYRPAHGQVYGNFCHSTITDAGKPDHAQAVTSASQKLLDWLFVRAPRVEKTGTVAVQPLAKGQTSAVTPVGATCPAGRSDAEVELAGGCRHPGYFDGDDHAIASSELHVQDGSSCTGAVSWTQNHDGNNKHAANLTWKTLSVRAGGGGLLEDATLE